MKTTIKLTSGKEIELTDQEYEELKQGFDSYIPCPVYPSYPQYNDLWPNYLWWQTYDFYITTCDKITFT